MKEKILALRAEGKSYNQIKEILSCSKSTISYYCGEGQKEKSSIRREKNRKDNPLTKKLENFKNKLFQNKSRDFQRNREKGVYVEGREYNFEEKEVLKRIIKTPVCYLTGRKIDIFKPKTYHFDHIIPSSKGGSSKISNLGLTCKEANIAKNDLSVEELFSLCKEILEYNGYQVKKNSE